MGSACGIGRISDCVCSVDPDLGLLSRTQFAVLQLITQGLTNAHIAEIRGISLKTVELHVNKIYEALALEPTSHYNARVRAAVRYARAVERIGAELA